MQDHKRADREIVIVKTHTYTIHFNGGSKKNKMKYRYGSVKDITLQISEQRATITFAVRSVLSAEDLISFKSKLFRDAYRKIHLIHALIIKQGLIVRKMEICIDGVSSYFDREHPSFPFMFSMIEKKDLGLSDAWSTLVPEVLTIPKSRMDNDLRFVSAFSYLASKSKVYRVERFTDLWTAMNAYYSYYASCYEKEIRAELGKDDAEQLPGNLQLFKKDGLSIGALGWSLFPKYKHFQNVKEAEALWKDNYRTEMILCNFSMPQIEELYNAAKQELEGIPLPEKYAELAACAETFGAPLFTYLLLIYPYHWRCNLFHGNRTTLLFAAYNDYEMAVLQTANYFLERFLNEAIPTMFRDDFFEGQYDSVKQFMRQATINDKGQSAFEKAFEKEKSKLVTNDIVK